MKRVPGSWRWRWVEVLHCPKEPIWRQRWGWIRGWRFWEGDWRWSWRCMGTNFHSTILMRLWECQIQIQIARRRRRKRGTGVEKERGWWNEKPWLKLKQKLKKWLWNEDVYFRVMLHSFNIISPNRSIQIHIYQQKKKKVN